ncbi:MAG TPA: hypothetical protein PLL66_08120 [Bacteroidales bacterium]|nr:hypothetical protein [Bacteroidales bacterium]
MLISTGILSAICVPLGIILDIQALVGIGPLVGVIIGMLIGEKIEEKNRKQGRIRPLNDKEVRNRKIPCIDNFIGWLNRICFFGI